MGAASSGLWSGKNFYTIMCPRTIKPNSTFTVVSSLHQSRVPAKLKISISGPAFYVDKIVEIQPYSVERISFQIPLIEKDSYYITAVGLAGITLKKRAKLNYVNYDSFSLVQTDKATYKPGDLVRFRILILDKETCPAKIERPVSISICDPQENTIKRIPNVKFIKGVYSGELQLSQLPNLGSWEILVKYGSETDKYNFKVEKYILPKFEVTIDAPKDVLFNDGQMNIVVRAKYTFGKPIKGKVTITSVSEPKYFSCLYNYNCEPSVITGNLDGSGSFPIKFEEMNRENVEEKDMYIKITAEVEETLTGIKQSATIKVCMHYQRYKIVQIYRPDNFIEDVPLKLIFAVKNFDGSPVKDTDNSIVVKMVPDTDSWSYSKNEEENKKAGEELEKFTLKRKLDENGMATIIFTPLKDVASFYSVEVNYLDKEEYFGYLHKQKSTSSNILELEVLTEKPRLDMNISMRITSFLPLKYFFYLIVARGDIVEAGKVEVPEEQNCHEFKFHTIFAMVPSCYIFAYYIEHGEIVFAEKEIEIEQGLNNFIEINAPTQAKVKDEIELKVKTNSDSYIGLLGVDQSVLLFKSGNDLSMENVVINLQKFGAAAPNKWACRKHFLDHYSRMITMTNATYPKKVYSNQIRSVGNRKKSAWEGYSDRFRSRSSFLGDGNTDEEVQEVTSRDFFPETWIWDCHEMNSENNEIVIRYKVPDTITSWILTGFSINTIYGLGLTNRPHKLQVYQPFFVSTHLPYSVKRGEVIAIPVIVFNYTKHDIKANLTLDNSHSEFEFAFSPDETNSIIKNSEFEQTKTIEIRSESGVSKSFLIRPMKTGQITLKISAISPIAGDIIKQVLRVDPEGLTQFVNKAVFFESKDQNEHTQEISIDVPEDVVSDSTYVELSVVGDLLGPTIKNLDQLVRKPYGCGEQNMVKFVPNILILKYLTRINKLTAIIEKKAKQFLEIGYQQQLTFKHRDGSYSAFGKRDGSGSTWLTAYVARAFCEAREFTGIDEKVIHGALTFLAEIQLPNGSFPEVGRIFEHHHVGKSGKGLSLTAFVLLAFLENELHKAPTKRKMGPLLKSNPIQSKTPNFHNTIDKGLAYLVKNIDDNTDTYSLAISAYALLKAKHEKRNFILEKLNDRQKKEDGFSWWQESELEKNRTSGTNKNCIWYMPKNANIEITAYALLAQLENGAGKDAISTLKWLVKQRNSNGGFSSTQDTVVGLQALIKFCEIYNVEKGDVEISFSDDKGGSGTMVVNDENAAILQSYVLNPESRLVKITGKGTGSTLVQISYMYNVNKRKDFRRFIIKVEVENTSNAEQVELLVHTCFVPLEDEKVSNMAVMEANLPSGYIADQNNLDKLAKVERVMKIELKNSGTIIVIYFDNLDRTKICLPIKGCRVHRVAEHKPSAITVYDYYDNNRLARTFYEINHIALDEICEGD